MLQDIININKVNTNETQYTSKPSEVSDVLEDYLFKIFEKELNTPNSVLLSYKPIAVKKIAADLLPDIGRKKNAVLPQRGTQRDHSVADSKHAGTKRLFQILGRSPAHRAFLCIDQLL